MVGFQLQRLGMVMEPEPGNPLDVEGVMNPAAVRGRDGQLYVFPRLVWDYLCIGIARIGVARLDLPEDLPTGAPADSLQKSVSPQPRTRVNHATLQVLDHWRWNDRRCCSPRHP